MTLLAHMLTYTFLLIVVLGCAVAEDRALEQRVAALEVYTRQQDAYIGDLKAQVKDLTTKLEKKNALDRGILMFQLISVISARVCTVYHYTSVLLPFFRYIISNIW